MFSFYGIKVHMFTNLHVTCSQPPSRCTVHENVDSLEVPLHIRLDEFHIGQ